MCIRDSNKIDRPDARIKEVIDEVLYLLMDLGATDEQLDCPMLFCCGRDGTASLAPDVPGTDLIPLFDTLLSTDVYKRQVMTSAIQGKEKSLRKFSRSTRTAAVEKPNSLAAFCKPTRFVPFRSVPIISRRRVMVTSFL